jgi:hypothetical protein
MFLEPFSRLSVQDGPHGQPHQTNSSLWSGGLGSDWAMTKRVQVLMLHHISICKRNVSLASIFAGFNLFSINILQPSHNLCSNTLHLANQCYKSLNDLTIWPF